MNRIRRSGFVAAAFLVVGGAGSAMGQIPALPVAAPAVVPPAPPVVAAPAEIKPGLLQKVWARLTAIRRGLCATPTGAFLNGATKPISAFTGGVIPQFCPQMPSERDTKKPGVAGAANAAKKEALEAKERQAAVRFLGTLDCRYFPDAPTSLALALRGDSSECVRYEAALMLGRGCCCTQKTVAALEASVAGTEMDGFPAERSIRVRCAASAALERCLSCYTPPPPDEEPKKVEDMGEKPPVGERPPGEILKKEGVEKNDGTIKIPEVGKLPAEYRLPTRAQAERAARTLATFQQQLIAAGGVKQVNMNGEEQSVFNIVKTIVQEMGPATGMESSPVTTAVATSRKDRTLDMFTGRTPSPVAMPARSASEAPMPMSARLINDPNLRMGGETPKASVPATAVAPATVTPATVAPAPVLTQPTAAAPAATSPMIAPTLPTIHTTLPAAPAMPISPPVLTVKDAEGKILASKTHDETKIQQVAAPEKIAAPEKTTADAEAAAAAASPAEGIHLIVARVEIGSTSADRHAAIRKLVKHDWRDHPQVVTALISTAKSDSDRAVRVDGIRHMSAYKVSEPQVIAALTELSADMDSWVAKEAAQALSELMLEKADK